MFVSHFRKTIFVVFYPTHVTEPKNFTALLATPPTWMFFSIHLLILSVILSNRVFYVYQLNMFYLYRVLDTSLSYIIKNTVLQFVYYKDDMFFLRLFAYMFPYDI